MNKQDLSKVILSDIDGCLLDWEHAFSTWMSEKGYKPVKNHKMMYDLENCYNLSLKKISAEIKEFNESAAIGFLPPLRDSMFYVKRLHEEHGFHFHALTSMGEDKNAHALRVMNLEKLFGPNTFAEYHFLPLHAPKDSLLKEYQKRGFKGFWIEDRVSNARVGTELGFTSLVMEHGYNMNENDEMFRFVKNWKEVYHIISSS